jgi:hypothetical protein
VSQSFGYIPKNGIAGAHGRSMHKTYFKELMRNGML